MWMLLKRSFCLVFTLIFCVGFTFGQTEGLSAESGLSPESGLSSESLEETLKTGITLYSEGKFTEAADHLRYITAIASDASLVSEALYWISLSELSAGDYNRALEGLSALERARPREELALEIPYHRGRILYYQGKFEDAIVSLSAYSNKLAPRDSGLRAAALYWIGESLYSLGQLDKAEGVFAQIVELYPESVKYEAASYRIDLIQQKKIEAELLSILKWSHEESLKTLEEYQRREKSYDQAIVAYQRRISDMLNESRTSELAGTEYELQMTDSERRIAALEASLAAANAALAELRDGASEAAPAGTGVPLTNTEKAIKLLSLKAEALELRNTISGRVNQNGGER
jgi:TolA-binding protein